MGPQSAALETSMSLDDPTAWAQGANAFKAIFDGLRSAIGLVKEVRASGGGSEAQQQLVDEALEKAGTAAKIAEAQVAKALGYSLCQCTFPPQIMLSIGRHPTGRERFECPGCHKKEPSDHFFEALEQQEAHAEEHGWMVR